MVEVLKQCNGNKSCECENCGSELRYMPSETFTEKRNFDYLGDFDVITVINCPVCKETTKV